MTQLAHADALQDPPKQGGLPPDLISSLVERMNLGDRDAVGEFLLRYGPLIRRRARGKLSATLRRVYDSQDVLSTVARRLVRYVSLRMVRATDDAQLMSLVLKIVESVVADRARLQARHEHAHRPGGPRDFSERRHDDASDPFNSDAIKDRLDGLLLSIPSPADRQLLMMWLNGTELRVIGEELGVTANAARLRWGALRLRLKAQLQGQDRE